MLSQYDIYSAASKSVGGDKPALPPKPRPLTDEELMAFGNFAGTTDVKQMASHLGKKGLIGASQLIADNPNLSTREGITNTQADWKTSAFSKLLIQARKFGLKTPTEITANKEALMASLDPRIKDALNHPDFQNIHPNFWETFSSVLKDQYANEPVPSIMTAKR